MPTLYNSLILCRYEFTISLSRHQWSYQDGILRWRLHCPQIDTYTKLGVATILTQPMPCSNSFVYGLTDKSVASRAMRVLIVASKAVHDTNLPYIKLIKEKSTQLGASRLSILTTNAYYLHFSKFIHDQFDRHID